MGVPNYLTHGYIGNPLLKIIGLLKNEILEDLAAAQIDSKYVIDNLANECLDQGDVRSVVANLFVVYESEFFTDEERKRLFHFATEVLEKCWEIDSQSRPHIRHLRILLGNHAFKFKQYPIAETLYCVASKGDTHVLRLALAKLNLARLYLATDKLNDALVTVESISYDKIPDGLIAKSLHLLRIRIFLLLGYVKTANAELVHVRNGGKIDPKTKGELLYLAYVTRVILNKNTHARIEQFERHVGGMTAQSQKSTFLLEMLTVSIIQGGAKEPKKQLSAKIKSLVNNAHNHGLEILSTSALSLHETKFREPAIKQFVDIASEQLKGSNVFATFCAGIFVVEKAIFFRRFTEAQMVLELLKQHILGNRSKIGEKVIAKLDEDDQFLMNRFAGLESKIPDSLKHQQVGLRFLV